jgi:hypothetical protein
LFCTRVNRGLLTICTNCTGFLPASVYVVAVNCDSLRSPATHYSRLLSCSVFVPRTRTISVLSRLGWLSLIIMYSIVLYCYYYLKLTGYVTFNTTSSLKDSEVVLTVQWIANPHVPTHHMVYHTFVSTCSLKNTGMISFERHICAVNIFFTSCLSKDRH